MSRRLFLSLIAIAPIFTPIRAQACGGYGDDFSIIRSTDADFLLLPSAEFEEEIARLALPKTRFKHVAPAGDAKDFNTAAEMEDLNACLIARGVADRWASELADLMKENRAAIAKHREVLKSGLGKFEAAPALYFSLGASATRGEAPPAPQEFQEYLHGWAAYQYEDLDAARRHFKRVLELPPDQRRWRGVWAAYMMGRSYQQSDPREAIKCFIKTRELAKAGDHDTLGLAAASFGWQARACLDLGEFDNAINLYLLQLAAGDKSAVQSLQVTAVKAFEAGDSAVQKLAGNPAHRAVLTAYVVAHGGPWQPAPAADRVRLWLTAIESGNLKNVEGADRLAWSAYQFGHYDLARRWADRADQELAIVQWIQAKLLLRDGKIEPAMQLLALAVKNGEELKQPATSHVRTGTSSEYYCYDLNRLNGELGALKLTRAQYAEALALLSKGDYWADAAYVAERVLTVDELKGIVDQSFPAPTKPTDGASPIRTLLARRFMRLGRWKDARPYFAPDLQKELDEYIAAIRKGHDQRLPSGERGLALFEAARIMRYSGMELAGTELGPDVAIWAGGTELSSPTGRKDGLLASSVDELSRLTRVSEQLDRRFQYRYTAADLAWEAAQLLPDNSAALADVLNRGGTWLKARDPIAAQRFYDALVKRCPNTETGKQAIQLKWFAPVKEQPTAAPGVATRSD